MCAAAPSAEVVAPLLLELARATRARTYYPAAHPTVQGALRRASVSWRDCLARHGTLRVFLRGAGFAVGDGDPVEGLGLEEFAGLLRERRVAHFDADPGLDLRELAILVDLLAAGGAEPLAALLEAHAVRHVRVGAAADSPSAEPPSQLRLAPLPGETAAPQPPEPVLGDEQGPETPAPTRPLAAAPRTARTPLPETDETPAGALSPEGAELLRELATLERCTRLGEYERTADRVDACVGALVAVKNLYEAYRALLVYSRHAADVERPPLLREVAVSRLRLAQGEDALLDYVASRALSRSTLTRVQAIQVLAHLGTPAVRVLLEQHDGATSLEARKLVSVLIAMGEDALPAVVDELADADPSRVRRAVSILGDMQNPRAVEFLADLVRHRDRRIAREAARALARVGNERALGVLIDLLGDGEEAGLLAASCLGGSRNRTAMRALIAVVPEGGGHAESVRQEAVRSLGRIGNPVALDCLIDLLARAPLFGRGRVRAMRCAAAHAIARIGGPRARQALQSHARGGDPAVRQACRQALREVERNPG